MCNLSFYANRDDDSRRRAELTEPVHPVTSFRLTRAARHAKLRGG
jgi:hypothetical protein